MRYGLGRNYNLLLVASSLALAILWFSGTGSKLVLILLQITLMLGFALSFGTLVKRLHQPPVLGEILGGIILGPTILGTIAPSIQFELFPVFGESSQILRAVSYLGIIAFVFIAGLEVDLTCIRWRSGSTLITSISGIVLPLLWVLEWLFFGQVFGEFPI